MNPIEWLGVVPAMPPEAVRKAIDGKTCPVCDSPLLVYFKRPPVWDWRVHCNHCGSEIPLPAFLNQEAWRVTAKL